MAINIKKTQDGFGIRPALQFKSRQNIEGSLGFDDDGFTFEGQVGQRYLQPVTSTSTMELDAREANIWKINLVGSVTSFGFKHGTIGTYIIQFIHDAVGGHTVTFASNFKWQGGTAPLISAGAANSVYIVNVFYDGTNYYGTFLNDLS